MNIAYQGVFLYEGLKNIGHNVIEVSFSEDDDINEKLSCIDSDIDIVLLELWGHKSIPQKLYACRHKLAAYCIDAPINGFWQIDLCRVFDYVFVDQINSVDVFRDNGINACWLPLCAQQRYFRNAQEHKDIDIAFVGNTSGYRIKRNNLLKLIKKYYNIEIFEGLSTSDMIDIFSRSKIVLNENLFQGLTLRVFQGLASGSLVLTEENGAGVDRYFKDNEHIVCYNSENVIDKIHNILNRFDGYREIALQGHMECKKFHTSEKRAHEFVHAITNNIGYNPKSDILECRFNENKSRYFLKMRFGGSTKEIADEFTTIAENACAKISGKARVELGNMQARMDKVSQAEKFYLSALNDCGYFYASVRLALLYAMNGFLQQSKESIYIFLTKQQKPGLLKFEGIFRMLQRAESKSEILYVIANILFVEEKIFYVGFLKQFKDLYPDTALEVAFWAWKEAPSAPIMDFMLEASQLFGIEGELINELVYGIEHCVLSDSQILYTARLLKRYYDLQLADVILSSYENAIV